MQIQALALGVCLGCLPEVWKTVDELISPIKRDGDALEGGLKGLHLLVVIETPLAFECPIDVKSQSFPSHSFLVTRGGP